MRYEMIRKNIPLPHARATQLAEIARRHAMTPAHFLDLKIAAWWAEFSTEPPPPFMLTWILDEARDETYVGFGGEGLPTVRLSVADARKVADGFRDLLDGKV